MVLTRNVMITLGSKSYSIETALDDATLNRVIGNIQRSFSDYVDIEDQEKSLLLACLDLSYRLETTGPARENDLEERDH